MVFSAIYKPTSLFSLRDSNSTNSGAKSLLLPSPYSIKMALINQSITIEGLNIMEKRDSKKFNFIKDTSINYFVSGSFCLNNCFVKILRPSRSEPGKFQETVSFREYIYITDEIEIIFEVFDIEAKQFLKRYLHRINYFGKRGCFFQFIKYNDNPCEPNVKGFEGDFIPSGLLQEFDDISERAKFSNVNNYDSNNPKRDQRIFIIPVQNVNSSKSYTHFRCFT